MHAMHLLISLLIALLLFCNLSIPTESTRVIFFNKTAKIERGQLLVTERRVRPCPNGQMRDHRNRCRKIINFGKSK